MNSMATDRRRNGNFAEGALDETNLRLLSELQVDARLSLAELGRRVGMSSPAVAERLQRLERDGVITGYRVEIDPRALGYQLTAVIRVRPAPKLLRQVAEVSQATPEVVECRRVTGEDCYVMTAHVRSVEHLEEVIDRFATLGQTTTSIAQSSPVPPRGLSLNGTDPGAGNRDFSGLASQR
jgi:Lrp/AsnC family leucine-responsive transcriptional regulator